MRQVLLMLLLSLLVCSGCFLRKSAGQGAARPGPGAAASSQPEVVVSPDKALVGKVVRFNGPGRFVVLNFQVGRLPATGQTMGVFRQGSKIGEVRVSGPQLDDNIVGDVIDGEAQAGDEVRSL